MLLAPMFAMCNNENYQRVLYRKLRRFFLSFMKSSQISIYFRVIHSSFIKFHVKLFSPFVVTETLVCTFYNQYRTGLQNILMYSFNVPKIRQQFIKSVVLVEDIPLKISCRLIWFPYCGGKCTGSLLGFLKPRLVFTMAMSLISSRLQTAEFFSVCSLMYTMQDTSVHSCLDCNTCKSHSIILKTRGP